MGLFSFIKRAAGGVGNVIRKVANFAVPVIRRVAQFSAPISSVAAGLAGAMGHPDLARFMNNVSSVSNAVGVVAPKVGQVIERVGDFGGLMADRYGKRRNKAD
jgi:hypothetical protein